MSVYLLHTLFKLFFVAFFGGKITNGYSNSSSYCGQASFSSDTGTITFSPSTRSSKRCTYQIRTRQNTRIVLKWKSFQVDSDMPNCKSSAVSIYVGCSSSKLIDFCSKNTASLPHDIYTRDNCLKLVFRSSKSSREEFRATYSTANKDQAVSTSSSCPSGDNYYAKSGVLYSPNWPTGYPQLWKDCEWDLKMPSNYLIKFSVMDMDIYRLNFYATCSSIDERLRIKGKKSKATSIQAKYYYCGAQSPSSVTTKYYELELEFQTKGDARANRGFIIGYIAYKSDDVFRWKFGYISILVVAIVLSVIFFAIKRGRAQRRLRHQTQPNHVDTAAVIHNPKPSNYTESTPLPVPPSYADAMSQQATGYPGFQMVPPPAVAYPSGPPPSYPVASASAPYPTAVAPPYTN
eukprot:gene8175-9052_t